MKALDDYFSLQKQIYDYFGYVEDWVVIPLDDQRSMFWRIEGGEGYGGEVMWAETVEKLNSDGDYYSGPVYTQRFLPKWVYRGAEFTMICVDTHTDGNKFLMVFDNTKERKNASSSTKGQIK